MYAGSNSDRYANYRGHCLPDTEHSYHPDLYPMKSKNTAPERDLRQELTRRKFRYRIHYRAIAGTPDIAFPKLKVALFVNGCFWHGHDCKYAASFREKPTGWKMRQRNTKEKDIDTYRDLKENDWFPVISWECRIKDNVEKEADRIAAILKSRTKY